MPADDTLDDVTDEAGTAVPTEAAAARAAVVPPPPDEPFGAEPGDGGDGGEGGDGEVGRPARLAAVIVAVVVMGFLAVLVWGVANRDDDPDSGPSPLDGKLAPALQGPTIQGGTFDLASQRGNWVVVNFFATWCVPCLQEHPELQRFAERNAGTNRRVVGVVFGGSSEVEPVRRFLASNGGTWPVVIDQGRIAVDYAVPKVPESILVSPTGLVYAKLRGGVTADDLDSLIDQVEQSAGGATSGPAAPGPTTTGAGG